MANNGNLRPWKPGQSGNPKGRRKKSETLNEMLREVLAGRTLLDQPVPDGKTVGQYFVETQIAHAIKGNALIAREIWERIEGKVPPADHAESSIDLEALLDETERIAREHKKRNGICE